MRRVFIGTIVLMLSMPTFAQWVARYNGPGNNYDYADAIAVDGSGNVYVTGRSDGSGTSYDYATIKYNSLGDMLWVRRYNGPGNGGDKASAIAVDDSGNVYVTGYSHGSGTGWSDYATIKYNPSGDTVWVRRYNGPGNDLDDTYAIAVNESGNVYVTGRSGGSGTGYDYATIKYNPSGDTVWVRRYNGPSNNYDGAQAIAVDDSGNVYVTGWSVGLDTSWDYATVKYDSTGNSVWVGRYNGPGNGSDGASAIAVDDSGNVYVTGQSKGSGTSQDYATIKYNSSGIEQWIRRYNGPGDADDGAMGIVVDGTGNIYVTGYSRGSGTWSDYATIKYNSSGDTVWVRRYDGPGNYNDYAYAIVIDDNGNIYVTGGSHGSVTAHDYATIKYNSSGDSVWAKRYNGPDNTSDGAYAISVDDEYVYVTGYSEFDYATIKYSSATGVEERGKRLEIRDWRLQIYPNPSVGNAMIKYGVSEKASISLGLYDISGRLVKTLYSGTQEKGYHTINVGAYHDMPTGIYFIRFETGEFKTTRKLTILK